METIIKGVLAENTLQDKVKSTVIAQLLKQIAGQSKADAAVLLDLALELKLSVRTNMSGGHRSQREKNSAACRISTPRRATIHSTLALTPTRVFRVPQARSLLENQTGDRILLAVSIAHRDVFWTRFDSDWLEATISATTTVKTL